MTTADVINDFIKKISLEIDWKYLKSQRCIKRTLGKLVFEIVFFSSKWNSIDESIEINADFRVWTKEYGKSCNINSIVCFISYRNGDKYWFDISNSESQQETYQTIIEEIKGTALLLYELFETDYKSAIGLLLDEMNFHKYHAFLDFIVDNLGIDSVRAITKKEYTGYSNELKQEIEKYRNGEKINTNWALNRSNTKFIADNGLMG